MKRYSTLQTKTPLKAKKPWTPKRTALKTNSTFKMKVTTTGFGTSRTAMARKSMRKVGKVGKANLNANVIIKKIVEEEGLNYCEIGKLGLPQFTDCMKTWPLQNVHRHKRAHYKGDAQQLSDRKQWVRGCQVCHDRIEHNKELTDEVFLLLRGSEGDHSTIGPGESITFPAIVVSRDTFKNMKYEVKVKVEPNPEVY